MSADMAAALPIPANIQVMVLFHFLQKIESGSSEHFHGLVDIGFLPDQIDRLRRLKTVDFVKLVSEDRPLIRVCGDAVNLDYSFSRQANSQTDAEIQAEFIRRGASASMMFQLFRLSRKQVTTRRTLLCVKSEEGRPCLPDEKGQHEIYRAWKRLKHPNVRERYLELHEAFPAFPLTVLYAVVGKVNHDF